MADPLLKASFRGVIDVRFPARVESDGIIRITRDTSGVYYFELDPIALQGLDQEIKDPGPLEIGVDVGTVRVNQTVGAPITLLVPSSTLKLNPVLISDWKGDAGTNPITVNLSGTDKLPGGLTSWRIDSDGGSIFLRPIPGVGFAL